MAERPDAPDFAAANGWDREYETYSDFDLPTYVGAVSFMKLPWITEPAALAARRPDVAIARGTKPPSAAVDHEHEIHGARRGMST